MAEAVERLRVALAEVDGEIYRVRNRSIQDPLNFPIKVNNRLANLLSMSEMGDGRPGSGMYAVFEIMVARLEGVWAEELEVVNGRLGDVGREGVVGGGIGGDLAANARLGDGLVAPSLHRSTPGCATTEGEEACLQGPLRPAP